MLNSKKRNGKIQSWREQLNGPLHERALWIYMVVVLGHWLEHLTQVYQVYIWGWLPKEAGGVLGLWFPGLAASEVLHFTYNLLLWAGILFLRPGFSGRGRKWWTVALAAQSWHFFEHTLLQVQWLTGTYLFGAAQQISIGQLWIPRVELHFLYNLIVFVPLVLGMIYHFYPPASEPGVERCTCAHRQSASHSPEATTRVS
jgi:hypothetical protein